MIRHVIAAVMATAYRRIIKPVIGFLLGILGLGVGLFFIGFEIALHLFVWTITVLAFFCVTGIEFGEWNRIMPFTFFNEGTNIAFPVAMAALIVVVLVVLQYIWLTLKRKKEKAIAIFASIFIFDTLWGYPYICISVAYKVLLSLGFSFYRWSYLYVLAFVVAVHVLLVLSIYTYNRLNKCYPDRITW